MTMDSTDSIFGPAVAVDGAPLGASIILVCEHASYHIPDAFHGMGLPADLLQSHVAWDPGALALARDLAERLEAPLVHGQISRLLHDCNRPPEAPDAIVAQGEWDPVPGNLNLSDQDRQQRVDHVYRPFHDRLRREIAARKVALELLVTVHTFTPVYRGDERQVQLGILHGQDPRFARMMFDRKPGNVTEDTRLNEPYSAADGVTHTLDLQGTGNGLLTVMLEVRSDLLRTPDAQRDWGARLAPWILETLAAIRPGARA